MSGTSGIQVTGVKQTLKTLNKLAPEMRKGFNKEYKNIVKPIVDDAKSRVPTQAPLSGMNRNWKHLGTWDGQKVKRGIVSKIDTRKSRSKSASNFSNAETVGALYVMSKTGYGIIYDMAGRKTQGSPFVQALQAQWGSASRSMWPAWETNAEKVTKSVADLVHATERQVELLIKAI
jgi:hypothetical protein